MKSPNFYVCKEFHFIKLSSITYYVFETISVCGPQWVLTKLNFQNEWICAIRSYHHQWSNMDCFICLFLPHHGGISENVSTGVLWVHLKHQETHYPFYTITVFLNSLLSGVPFLYLLIKWGLWIHLPEKMLILHSPKAYRVSLRLTYT